MNTLRPFIRHEMDNLPNDTHNVPRGSGPSNQTEKIPDGAGCHCVPCHQKSAQDFLKGSVPGRRQFYAPQPTSEEREDALQKDSHTAYVPACNTAVVDDEIVERMVEWREEAPHG